MKITFVTPAIENQGIEILSALLREVGHETELVVDYRLFDTEAIQSGTLKRFFDGTKRIVEEVLLSKPDLVGFSVYTISYQWALALARRIKAAANIPVIFGGIHPTTVPERVIAQDAVDMVCIGEGEEALLELAEAIDRKDTRTDILNLWFKKEGKVIRNAVRPLIADLDHLPFPDKDLFARKGLLDPYEYNLSSGRGCPFQCTYCGNNTLKRLYAGKGRYLRTRSVDLVIAEAKMAKARYAPKVISFYADVFTTNKAWLKAFCRRYGPEVGLPFFALSHPRFMDDDVAHWLKEAGCLEVTMGVESATPALRKELLQRPESDEEILAACDSCRRHDLRFSLDHLINLPRETEEHHRDALAFYNRLRPDSLNVYPLQYYPGVAITETACRDGIVSAEMREHIGEGEAGGSMVIGVGGKDPFDEAGRTAWLRFLLTALPFLPSSAIEIIIRRGWYRKKIQPPMMLFAVLKILTKIRVHRLYVYRGIVSQTLRQIGETLRWKVRVRA
jgi:anaerobic magnesium-protoporphyrin IX monomethyl ester cyclase